LQDFTWWSGLTMAEAKRGIEMVRSKFRQEAMNGQTYWLAESTPSTAAKSTSAYLLPNYDEYFIGLKDRSAIGDVMAKTNISKEDPSVFAHLIILDGQIVGGWKRALVKKKVVVELSLFTKLKKTEQQAVAEASDRYGRFLDLPVELLWKK